MGRSHGLCAGTGGNNDRAGANYKMKKELSKVYSEFEKYGLLLLSDPELPSLVTMIAGEPVKGSWWGHPKGNLIYNLSQELEDDTDILIVKLLNKKITYVHKRHWNALFSIVLEKSDWQIKGLKPDHKNLFRTIQKRGSVRADDASFKNTPTEIGKQASKLEERLLVYSQSLHTESGKHVRQLKSWESYIKEIKFPLNRLKATEAYEYFESVLEDWSSGSMQNAKVPWKQT